jgi:hypothetical protein
VIQFFEKALDLATGPNRGNELVTVRLEHDIVQSSQVQLYTIAEDCLAPTMQSTDSADALAAVPVEDFQDFLLVGWGIGRRRLKHSVATEVLAMHAKRPPRVERNQSDARATIQVGPKSHSLSISS